MRHEDIELIPAFSFRQHVPNLDLTIYEKEDGIGGTWHASRYPVRAIVSSFPGVSFAFVKKSSVNTRGV